MAESIEQLGEIIKEQSRKWRKFNDRLGDCEVKLFGAARDERKKKKTVAKDNLNNSNLQRMSKKENKSPNTSFTRVQSIPQK